MLVDPHNLGCDVVEITIHDMIAKINGNSTETIRHEKGVYEIGHFNFDCMINEAINKYPEVIGINSYGVCDNYKQIIKQHPILVTSNKKYVISITAVVKDNQSKQGGWRWHKWGPYIGEEIPTTEYLYDEPKFKKIYVYHIFELI